MQNVLSTCKTLLSCSDGLKEFEVLRSQYGTQEREVTFVDDLTETEYFDRFLLPNKACLVGEKLTREWLARKDWVADDGGPNWEHLREHYGNVKVPVADCQREQYGSHVKIEMTMAEYLDYWQEDIRTRPNGDCATTTTAMETAAPRATAATADPTNADLIAKVGKRRILYLKDWHFCRAFKDSPVYQVPTPFSSDWLNEYWDASDAGDDYRFVYMGPKGTWTPFHADVFRSYSWSTNVCGRKRWFLFPPGEEDAFRDRFGAFPLDVTSVDVAQDRNRFPAAGSAQLPIVVIQEAGQTIFVPSGWHHQVENLEDTISINHNWGNACNIGYLWTGLKDDLKQVEEAISDCRDMVDYSQHCQLLLRAHSGLNFYGFLQMLLIIARPRLAQLEDFTQSCNESKQADGAMQLGCCEAEGKPSFNGVHMVVFDLVCLSLILLDLLAQPACGDCFTDEQQAVFNEATGTHKSITSQTRAHLSKHGLDGTLTV